MVDRDYSPREVIAIVRRRRWPVLAAVCAGLALASAASLALPKSYKCSTRLEVSANKSLPGSEYSQQVDSLTQQITSMVAVERVVDDLGLAEGSGAAGSPEERRAGVARNLINATRVEKEEPNDGTYFVRVTHTARDPQACYRILTALVGGYKQELYDRPRVEQSKVVEAARGSVEHAEQIANDAQSALTAFEDANRDFLGDIDKQLGDVRREIQKIQEEDLVRYRDLLKRADDYLRDEPQFIEHKSKKKDSVRLAALESDINKAEAKLNELVNVKKFTEEHPEVGAQRSLLAQLERRKKELEDNAEDIVTMVPNQLYVDYTRQRDEAASQLKVAESKLAALQRNERDLTTRIVQAAQVKNQHARLASEKEAAQKTLNDRRHDLTKAEDKLRTIADERQLNFRVVDEPMPPRSPSGAPAAVFALGGIVVGAAAGLGVAWVLDAQDRSFREVDAVAEFLGVPSLGAIHVLETPSERAEARRKTLRVATAVGALALVAVVLAGAAVVQGASPAPGTSEESHR